MNETIYTIGHSTHPIVEFIRMAQYQAHLHKKPGQIQGSLAMNGRQAEIKNISKVSRLNDR